MKILTGGKDREGILEAEHVGDGAAVMECQVLAFEQSGVGQEDIEAQSNQHKG